MQLFIKYIKNMKSLSLLVIALLMSSSVIAHSENLDTLRAATEKYKDVKVALAEGFIPDPSGHCISAAAEGLPAEWGDMGIHYINPAMLKITAGEPRVDGNSTHTDFTRPAILLYEPQADGSLVLMGIENLVWIQVEGFDRVFTISNEDLERSNAEKTSAVHFMRFELEADMIAALRAGAVLSMGSSHQSYAHKTESGADTTKALLADLD